MKRRSFITGSAAGMMGAGLMSCAKPSAPERKPLARFIHFSDIHVQPEQGAHEGFLAAIGKMNELEPDFVVGGGDMIMDALGVGEERAVMLYGLYNECIANFTMPVHHVMGNHEVFGVYVPDQVSENHPEWGKTMYKNRLGDGKTYRSFDHNGVHFVMLDSIMLERRTDKPGYAYYGGIDDVQMAWLRNDLGSLAPGTPIVGFSHIPLYTMYEQVTNGPTHQTGRGTAITNGKELHALLAEYNTVAYLQGHIHVNELYEYKGIKFIDTAAVSGGWWKGARDGHPEGFNLVEVYEDGVEYQYMTYGWDASKYAAAELDRDIFPFA